MNREKVSVIMSTYNEPSHWIKSSIDSILNQTYKNIELIIVCDNPVNYELIKQLECYAESDKRIKLIINETNLGLTKSLNKALKEVTGDYIARMDSDDISYTNRIEEQIKYLKENNLDLIGSGVVCIDENDKEIYKLNNFPTNSDKVKKKIVYNNCLAHPTWFGKTIVFSKNNGYRNISYAEDYDFSLRALSNGFKLGNVNKILLQYRIRSSSISNKSGLKQFIVSQELVKAFKENYITREEGLILNNINNTLKEIDTVNEEEYYLASKEFSQAAMKLKRLNILGIANLVRSFLKSSFYRRKIICYIRGLM